jgi:ABC-type oligopeptide transport system substrate-binding subunit
MKCQANNNIKQNYKEERKMGFIKNLFSKPMTTECQEAEQKEIEKANTTTEQKVLNAFNGTYYYKRVTREDLCNKTQMDDRKVRNAIHDLRMKGHHICSDTEIGGYYLGTNTEWNLFCNSQRRRAINNFYRKTDEIDGQIMLHIGG